MPIQNKKRKATVGGEAHTLKTRRTNTGIGISVAVTEGDVSVPTHQQVLEGFLLTGLDINNQEALVQHGENQGLRFLQSSGPQTTDQILRKIQEHFARPYHANAASHELRKLVSQAPKSRGRWSAMNALAQWDLQAEEDIERARQLGEHDLGLLPENPSREQIKRRLDEEFEAFRRICREREYDEPGNLSQALNLVEMATLTESISALGLPVPSDVDRARELLRQWDADSQQDLQALGLDPTLPESETRPQVWARIAEADQPLRERAIARGYDVDSVIRTHEMVKILTTSYFGESEEALVAACQQVGLDTDTKPYELRKRLLDHEIGIFLMRYLGGREKPFNLDALSIVTDPTVDFRPKGVSASQTTPTSTQNPLPPLDPTIHEHHGEPSPDTEYLYGLGGEPESIYRQTQFVDESGRHGLLFAAFAAGFFNDHGKWAWVQEEAQKIFSLALFEPAKLAGGKRNYVRCVRHDWYRELNQKAAASGGASLRDQLWGELNGTAEMVQLLADVYHVQIIVHFRTNDHRWDLIVRGPSPLEGAREQIHLIHWRDEGIWTSARKIAPEGSWLSNFPNHPLSIMPLIPVPNFTDGIRPMPLIRDPMRDCEEDYLLEMNDPPPLPPKPQGQEVDLDTGEVVTAGELEFDERPSEKQARGEAYSRNKHFFLKTEMNELAGDGKDSKNGADEGQDLLRKEKPAAPQHQHTTSDWPTPFTPNALQIPGLGLVDSASDAPPSASLLKRLPAATQDPKSLAQYELLPATSREEETSLVEEDSVQNSVGSRSGAPSPDPHHPSQYSPSPVAGEAIFDEGAVYFQGQTVPPYDGDSPSHSSGRGIGPAAEDQEDDSEDVRTLGESVEGSSRTGYAEDLDDPVDDWQDRRKVRRQHVRHPSSPLHHEAGIDADADDGDRIRGSVERLDGDYANEMGYDSLFDE